MIPIERILLTRLLLFALDQSTKLGHLSPRVTTESRGRCLPRYVDGARVTACMASCILYRELVTDAVEYLGIRWEDVAS